MGLPMFQEPDEAVAHDAAAKLDRAAATQRSTIRRQPSVRPSRYNPSAARERIRERYYSRSDEERNAELQIAQMEAEIARLRTRRSRARDYNSSLRDAEDLVQQSRAAFRDDDENEERETTRTRRYNLPRPNRESSLRFEVSAPRSSSLSPHRLRLLSPPSSSGSGRNLPDANMTDSSNGPPNLPHYVRSNVPDGPILDDEPNNLTQGFAPARYHREDPRTLETPPPETWESSLPPLGRVSRRPDRPPFRSIDGLGDRRRSPSPDPNAEEETWANLLTTMEAGRSSTATSFASNGDSGSRSRNSQTTMATSFGEIGADDGCDMDLPTGITEEIAREIREQHRSFERQVRRNGEPDGPVMTGEQGLRMHEARVRRAREAREGSRQIQMIQQIMERFGSREDVPDDWWTIMGWDDDVSEPRRESSRPRRQPTEQRRSQETRLSAPPPPHEHMGPGPTRRHAEQQMQQAEEIMQELRSQGSQEIL